MNGRDFVWDEQKKQELITEFVDSYKNYPFRKINIDSLEFFWKHEYGIADKRVLIYYPYTTRQLKNIILAAKAQNKIEVLAEKISSAKNNENVNNKISYNGLKNTTIFCGAEREYYQDENSKIKIEKTCFVLENFTETKNEENYKQKLISFFNSYNLNESEKLINGYNIEFNFGNNVSETTLTEEKFLQVYNGNVNVKNTIALSITENDFFKNNIIEGIKPRLTNLLIEAMKKPENLPLFYETIMEIMRSGRRN